MRRAWSNATQCKTRKWRPLNPALHSHLPETATDTVSVRIPLHAVSCRQLRHLDRRKGLQHGGRAGRQVAAAEVALLPAKTQNAT
jgi:hypothetical protein